MHACSMYVFREFYLGRYLPTAHRSLLRHCTQHKSTMMLLSSSSVNTHQLMKSVAITALFSLQPYCSNAFQSPQNSPYTATRFVSERKLSHTTVHMSLEELVTPQNGEPINHPQDNAKTTPQLLHALWGLIADASENMQRGDSFTVMFPHMDSLQNGEYVTKLLGHLDTCKDVCDNFGVNTVISPYMQAGATSKVIGFTVKSYRNPNMAGTFNDDASSMKFAPDPFWDEDEVWDFSELDSDEVLTEEEKKLKSLPEIEDRIPSDDSLVVDISKKWVDRMMADLALCPFTRSGEKSGIPLGPVRYAVDRVSSMEGAYAAYWQEVCLIEGVNEADVSTTLQILPEFCMNSVESEFFFDWDCIFILI